MVPGLVVRPPLARKVATSPPQRRYGTSRTSPRLTSPTGGGGAGGVVVAPGVTAAVVPAAVPPAPAGGSLLLQAIGPAPRMRPTSRAVAGLRASIRVIEIFAAEAPACRRGTEPRLRLMRGEISP